MANVQTPFSQRDLDFIVSHFNRMIQRGDRNLRSVIRQIGGIFPPLRAAQVIAELEKRNNKPMQGGKKRGRKKAVRILITHEGSLVRYGYHMKEPIVKRRSALLKSINDEGYARTMRRLNALYVYNKNRFPSLAKKLTSDKAWMRREFQSR